MSGANKYAVLKEFPFLSRFCHPTQLIDACVKRFDKEVLSIKLLDCTLRYDGAYLLDARGNALIQFIGEDREALPMHPEYGTTHRITMPIRLLKPRTWFFTKWDEHNLWRDSTVSDLFTYLGPEVRHVKYAVDIRKGVLTLHKPPKGFKMIGDWLFNHTEELRSGIA
jgi:hypothetical protein